MREGERESAREKSIVQPNKYGKKLLNFQRQGMQFYSSNNYLVYVVLKYEATKNYANERRENTQAHKCLIHVHTFPCNYLFCAMCISTTCCSGTVNELQMTKTINQFVIM